MCTRTLSGFSLLRPHIFNFVASVSLFKMSLISSLYCFLGLQNSAKLTDGPSAPFPSYLNINCIARYPPPPLSAWLATQQTTINLLVITYANTVTHIALLRNDIFIGQIQFLDFSFSGKVKGRQRYPKKFGGIKCLPPKSFRRGELNVWSLKHSLQENNLTAVPLLHHLL